jgi:hypothetical protein
LQSVLRLRQELNKKTKETSELESSRLTLLENNPLDSSLDELDMMVAESKAHRDRLSITLSKQTQALGVSDQHSLKNLMKSEYLSLRMNMRAKKQRIRERIRRRKFELSRVERSHRHSVNGTSIFAVLLKNHRSHEGRTESCRS